MTCMIESQVEQYDRTGDGCEVSGEIVDVKDTNDLCGSVLQLH